MLFDFTSGEWGLLICAAFTGCWSYHYGTHLKKVLELIQSALQGDEKALSLLMHLDLRGGKGVCLVLWHNRHSCYGKNGRKHHCYSSPSHSFVQAYLRFLQQELKRNESQIARGVEVRDSLYNLDSGEAAYHQDTEVQWVVLLEEKRRQLQRLIKGISKVSRYVTE